MTAEVAATSTSIAASRPWRAVFAVPAVAALLAGLDGALSLLGVWSPVPGDRTAEAHGSLMTLGFLGTLIALERAVALRRRAAYSAPACLSAGALLMLAPHTRTAGAVLLVVGAAVLVAVYGALWRRRYDQAVVVQGLGAVLALGAAICLLGGVPVQSVVPWLAGFLVLTIAGERLELATLHMPPHAGRALVLLAASVGCGALIALLWPASTVLFGVVLAGTAAWLVRFDVARRTVRAGEPARFMACAMLAGQAWLVVAASLWLVTDPASTSEAVYDATTHAVFLGFAMSMVMAHAPVILPAVVRIPLSHHRGMYLPLLLLHAGLVVRLWLGDALGLRLAWQVGGVVTVLSLLGFLAAVGWSLIRTGDKRGAR
ncbi:hypothetical protein [Thermocrispum municipale]|jgi:hypothetical protein|uniref:hypothetical protein n=1 Tax=Thermocrispum municipale TaxID=37926 RepID=UPI0003FD4358|nr:hypothetical protein [Thermocrispum municipale]